MSDGINNVQGPETILLNDDDENEDALGNSAETVLQLTDGVGYQTDPEDSKQYQYSWSSNTGSNPGSFGQWGNTWSSKQSGGQRHGGGGQKNVGNGGNASPPFTYGGYVIGQESYGASHGGGGNTKMKGSTKGGRPAYSAGNRGTKGGRMGEKVKMRGGKYTSRVNGGGERQGGGGQGQGGRGGYNGGSSGSQSGGPNGIGSTWGGREASSGRQNGCIAEDGEYKKNRDK